MDRPSIKKSFLKLKTLSGTLSHRHLQAIFGVSWCKFHYNIKINSEHRQKCRCFCGSTINGVGGKIHWHHFSA